MTSPALVRAQVKKSPAATCAGLATGSTYCGSPISRPAVSTPTLALAVAAPAEHAAALGDDAGVAVAGRDVDQVIELRDQTLRDRQQVAVLALLCIVATPTRGLHRVPDDARVVAAVGHVRDRDRQVRRQQQLARHHLRVGLAVHVAAPAVHRRRAGRTGVRAASRHLDHGCDGEGRDRFAHQTTAVRVAELATVVASPARDRTVQVHRAHVLFADRHVLHAKLEQDQIAGRRLAAFAVAELFGGVRAPARQRAVVEPRAARVVAGRDGDPARLAGAVLAKSLVARVAGAAGFIESAALRRAGRLHAAPPRWSRAPAACRRPDSS